MRRVAFIVLCGWSALAGAGTATESAASVNLIQITLSLLLVVGVLLGFAVLFKKFGLNRMMNNGPFPVKVIGAVSIGNNQRLMVIEVNEEWIVLGVTAQQINTIATMPRQEAADIAGPGNKLNFSTWMQSALEKYNAKKP